MKVKQIVISINKNSDYYNDYSNNNSHQRDTNNLLTNKRIDLIN